MTVVALAGVEVRRLLTHPVVMVLVGIQLLGRGVTFFVEEPLSRPSVAEWLYLLVFVMWAPLNIISANLVATSARRAGAAEVLDSLPVTAAERSGALLLAACGPVLIGTGAAFACWLLMRGLGPTDVQIPAGGELAAAPVTILGAVALAVAGARWLPSRITPFVLLVAVVLWIANSSTAGPWRRLSAPWLVELSSKDTELEGYSALWHVAYLLGLCALAAVAAIWRDDLRRLTKVGTPVVLFAGFASLAQLP